MILFLLKTKNYKLKTSGGALLVQVLVFATVGSVLLGALALWGVASLNATRKAVLREQAFHIAEAGIEYYRWHLAHFQNDYQDGTGHVGPYVHTYQDKLGNTIGSYSLTITPPPLGATTVVITSIGSVAEDSSITRKVQATLALASFAKYAILTDSSMVMGTGAQSYGLVHSNHGIQFNGVAHNIVSAAIDTYDDDGHTERIGVNTNVSPVDPVPPVQSIPSRPDVFLAGRQFPPFYTVPAVSFASLTATMLDLKTKSLTSSGFHLSKAGGNSAGYHIVLKINGTFDVYNVDKLVPRGSCPSNGGQSGWELGAIDTETKLSTNNYPANGIIFVEDDLWIDGQVNNTRVTLAAGSFSGQEKNITINHGIRYTNYDGTDVIGIFGQNNINIGWQSDDNLRIDAALIAKDGSVQRFKFDKKEGDDDKCSPYDTRASLYLYGSMTSFDRPGFAYADGTGYQTRTYVYDQNLFYSPPPSFPLVSSNYALLKWREIQ
ncbi:MAG: hypothetical protein WC764_01890 [Candidatus Paceibacterota bacterium]|jgi:hypothetical protein